MTFKIGDTVICIDSANYGRVFVGKKYLITGINHGLMKLKDMEGKLPHPVALYKPEFFKLFSIDWRKIIK